MGAAIAACLLCLSLSRSFSSSRSEPNSLERPIGNIERCYGGGALQDHTELCVTNVCGYVGVCVKERYSVCLYVCVMVSGRT